MSELTHISEILPSVIKDIFTIFGERSLEDMQMGRLVKNETGKCVRCGRPVDDKRPYCWACHKKRMKEDKAEKERMERISDEF